MKKWEPVRMESDAEVYNVGGHEVKVIWGWATGSDMGEHNNFNTEVLVKLDGEDYEGYDVDAGEEPWDEAYLEAYENKTIAILNKIENEVRI